MLKLVTYEGEVYRVPNGLYRRILRAIGQGKPFADLLTEDRKVDAPDLSEITKEEAQKAYFAD